MRLTLPDVSIGTYWWRRWPGEVWEDEDASFDPLSETYDGLAKLGSAFLKRWGLAGRWKLSWFIENTGECGMVLFLKVLLSCIDAR